jgi:hypothetical protein
MSLLRILIHELLLRLSLSIRVEPIRIDNSRRFVSCLVDLSGSRVYESPFCLSRPEALRLAREYRDFLIHTSRRNYGRARV